jgi:hypothetical protein
VSAKQQLANLAQEADYAKYRKHLEVSITTLSNATADSNDALGAAKESLKKQVDRRRAREAQKGNDDDEGEEKDKENGRAEKTPEEIAAEEQVRDLEAKVDKLTKEAEKAMRELIDYSEELKGQDALVRGVVEQVFMQAPARPSNNAVRAAARRRRVAAGADSDDDEDVNMPDADDEAPAADILSPTELLKQAKENYTTQYTRKSMRARYADNNDYQTFKKLLHDASYYGPDAPPLPPASSWFPSDAPASRSRRAANNADHTSNGAEDSDDELVFAGEVSSLKCPLTLQTFKEPYSNHTCKHTFEKSALLEMFDSGSTVFYDNGHARGRNRGAGTRKLKCPQAGCEAMLELKDFYDDQMVKRQVRRAKAQEAAEREAEEEMSEQEEAARLKKEITRKRQTMDVERVEDSQRVKRQEVESEDDVLVKATQM